MTTTGTTATTTTTTGTPTAPDPGWLMTPAEPRSTSAVPGGVEYHRVLSGDSRRIGRGVLAIVLLLAGFVLFPTVIGRALAVVDTELGNTTPIVGGTDYTPLYHAGTMLSLGLLMPWSMLIQRWLYGVPAASLHSVTSRFRFDLFGKALVVFGPVWMAVIVLGFLAPGDEVPWSRTDLVAILLGTLLLTPLQTTGEEYGVRGLLLRVLGGWARNPRTGLVVAVLGTSVLFTALHGSTDPYITVWYLVLWTSLALITWRTGGLEVAVVLHALLNTVSFIVAPYLRADLGTQIQDRSAGVGSPYLLVPALVVAVIAAVVWWWTRRTGPARTPSR